MELPTVLIPGLGCSPRLYASQIFALWKFGPVVAAKHTHDNSLQALARAVLVAAPPRFALVGLSMGGYMAFEIMRRAPERVARLALLDTTARPDTPEQTQRRRLMISAVQAGKFESLVDTLFPAWVHPSRHQDEALKAILATMFAETGPEAFIRQQSAIMARPDSRPGLAEISCPTLVLVGEGDELTPPSLAQEIAGSIPKSTFVTVPDCGHLSPIEQPDFVTARLVEWLEQ